jgi:Flp pilus assembly protein TadG
MFRRVLDMIGWRRLARSETGNTTVLFALCLPAIVGFAGLGVETGYWQFKQRQLQTAADMAAYAGAVALRNNESEAQSHQEAEAEAAIHAFDAAVGSFDANTPPEAGENRNTRSVEVVLTQQVERFVSQIFNDTPVILEVRAVATHEDESEACVLALSHTESEAIKFYGNSNINLIECEVMSNSIAPDALQLSGSTDVVAPCLNAVGGFAVAGGSADYDLTGCRAPRTNLPRAQDPFEDVDEPYIPSNCSSIPGGGPPGSTYTVSAGAGGVKRFCNGLNLTRDYEFEPGVYVIDGGRFRAGANANVYGEGVTFYLTGGAEVDFNGSAEIDLTAPTSGEYAGIVFFGDRDDDGVEHKFNGTADSSLTGAIYTPAGDISFLGDFSGENGCMFLVGNTISIGGNANITTDCSGTGIDWAEVPSNVLLVE